MWRSMGRPPMAQPPGMATRAMPVRAMSGPRTSELARMVLTISYLATGSERTRAPDAGAVLGAAVAEFDLGAHGGEELALGLDVADLGDVFEDDLVFGEDGGGHAGEGGVFCAGDFDGAEKRVAAAYYELVHLSEFTGIWRGNEWLRRYGGSGFVADGQIFGNKIGRSVVYRKATLRSPPCILLCRSLSLSVWSRLPLLVKLLLVRPSWRNRLDHW